METSLKLFYYDLENIFKESSNLLSLLMIFPMSGIASLFPQVHFLVCVSCSVRSDSLQPHGVKPTRLFSPWDSPGKNTEVGCHFLLQGIFPTQGPNLGLPHCKQFLYHLSHQGSLVHFLPVKAQMSSSLISTECNLFLCRMCTTFLKYLSFSILRLSVYKTTLP